MPLIFLRRPYYAKGSTEHASADGIPIGTVLLVNLIAFPVLVRLQIYPYDMISYSVDTTGPPDSIFLIKLLLIENHSALWLTLPPSFDNVGLYHYSALAIRIRIEIDRTRPD